MTCRSRHKYVTLIKDSPVKKEFKSCPLHIFVLLTGKETVHFEKLIPCSHIKRSFAEREYECDQ